MFNLVNIDLQNPDVYKHKVWGDTGVIASLVNRASADFDDDVIGEVWLCSAHNDGKSKLTDGRTFDEVIATDSHVFGNAITPKKAFPILVKALSATEPLSVQTHYKNKVEAWVTLSNGEMLYGLTEKGADMLTTVEKRDAFGKILYNTTDVAVLAEYFNHVRFGPGESYILQAGMAHALLSGTILEPQKSSNLTLRGGDWGRKQDGRPLHLEDFYASIYPFQITPQPIEKMYKMKTDGAYHACLFATDGFAADEIVVSGGTRTIETFDDRFFFVMVMDGTIDIHSASDSATYEKGQAFIMCANPNQWTFSGNGRVILSYVPHLRKGIIDPLHDNGYSYESIASIGGPVQKENDLYIEMKELELL